MNAFFKLQLQKLVKDAYTQHECPHGEFKKKYAPEYLALTNTIQIAAHGQLSAHEFQTWNQPITVQALIKRMWRNTRSEKKKTTEAAEQNPA